MSTAAKNITATWYFEGEERSLADINGGSYGVWVGYNSVDGEMVGRIAFTLEQAAGGLSIAWRIGQGTGGSKTFNYAIVRADEDDGTLKNAKYPMTGDGTLTSRTSAWTSFSMSIERILSAGTYHMYIWTATTSASNYMGILSNSYYPITVAYDAIAGTASTIALTGGALGSPVKIQITRNNADFVHTLSWSFAGHSGTVAAKTGDTIVLWTPDADTFGAYIPTASSGTLTVSCTTYYAEEQIGAAQTASLNLSVPSDAAPTLSDGWASVSYSNSGTAAEGIAACIAGYSMAVVTFDESKVTAKYGATVKTLTAAMGGSSVTGSGTIGTVSGTGDTVTLTATDSRGKKTSQTVTLSALAYTKPVLGGVAVFRCNSAGAEDDSGAYYSAEATVTYSTAGGKISCALTAAVKAVGGNYGTAAALTPGTASVLGGGLSATVSYIVRIRAVDTLGNAAAVEVMIPTAAVAFHIRDGGDGMGLGKYGEIPGAVDCAWDIEMNGNKISGLGEPTEDGDAVPKSYADGAVTALQEYAAGAFAPAGYGLGGVANGATFDADAALETGWYSCCLNTPTDEINNEWYHVLTIRHVHGIYRIQIAWSLFYTRSAQRLYLDGQGFGEWEWINPPMRTGVEYRTTERWDGKAVYTVNIDQGNSASGTTVVDTQIAATAIVRVGGAMGRFGNPFIHTDEAYSIWGTAQISGGKIRTQIHAGSNMVNLKCNLHVWYTKE